MSRFSWRERWKTVATDAYTMLEDILSLVHGVNRLYDLLPISEISSNSISEVPDIDADDLSKGKTVGIWWSGATTINSEQLIDNSINWRERLIHYVCVKGKIADSVTPGRFTKINNPISSSLFERAFAHRFNNETIEERSFWSGPGQADISTSKNFSSRLRLAAGVTTYLFVNTSGELKIKEGSSQSSMTLFVMGMPQIKPE